MRLIWMMMLIALLPAVATARISLPEPQFRLVDAWILPNESAVNPNPVTFTANTDAVSRLDEPILLGKMDFSSYSPNSAFTFSARFEMTGPDRVPQMLELTSELPMIAIAAGPINAQALFFGMMPMSGVAVDGQLYGLNLTGVTETPELKDALPLIGAELNKGPTTGYVWGTVTQNMADPDLSTDDWEDLIFQTTGGQPTGGTGGQPQDHCHQTPEPATWIMALLAVVCLGGLGFWKRRPFLTA